MKSFIKKLFEKSGIRLNFLKNLWYLDSFYLMRKICTNQKPFIFDVGACDGSSIAVFKKMFPGSFIYSFEPYPDSYKNLDTFSKNYSDVKIFQLALSHKNDFMDFYVNKSKATNSLLKPALTNSFIDEHAIYEETIRVKTVTLDSFFREHAVPDIDILKLDVQGGELMVFKGADETLRNKKIKIIYTEIWFIEAYSGQPLYHDIAGHLSQYGYVPFGVYNIHYRKDGHFLWGDAIFYLK